MAMIDGCTRIGAFFRVSLPIVAPGLAATAILSFIYCWNEFLR
jgi:ABC-type glycerol-3-phosphate transport system permease component